MRARRGRLTVSGVWKGIRVGPTAALVAALAAGACVGGHRSLARIERADAVERRASGAAVQPPRTMLQFDNESTSYVDVYLAGPETQWRLGRVPPGARISLRVPESAINWTAGFVRLAVIAGSPMSVQAWRDPHAVTGIEQPVSELLLQRWTFRQPGAAAQELEPTRLTGSDDAGDKL